MMRIFTDIFQKAMKKVLLLFVFAFGYVSLLSAQKKFHIDITSMSISPNPAKIGQMAKVTIHLQNDGAFPLVGTNYQPDTFPGGTYYFNYNAGVGTVNEGKVDFSHAILLSGMGWEGTETVEDSFVLTKAFFQKGAVNIIIVWPTGGKAISGNDSLDTIPNAIYTLTIDSTSGIIPRSTQASFKIYPNPTKDVVNIQMNESGTGNIRLMNMMGKLVASWPYTAKAGENISLPLMGCAAIPDGLYLINIETAHSSDVSKVMICR